jgi:hypothetical protein
VHRHFREPTRLSAVVAAAVLATGVLASCTSGTSKGSGAVQTNTSPGSTSPSTVPNASIDDTPGSTGSIDPVVAADRVTTWRPGVSYGGGGIPERTQVCTTLAPSGGDDTGAIQAALDSCPTDHVVQLKAGTFKINGGGLAMRRSGVTLRGAGSGKPGTGAGGTRLVKADREEDRGDAILYVGNNPALFASSTDLSADAVKGTNTVTLVNDPGLKVGEYVLVDHVTNDDPDVVWGPHHDGPGGAGTDKGSRRWFDRQDRSLSQILEITAIDGKTITFATPFHWTFRKGFDAQLSRYGDDNGGNVLPFVERVGIEDIYFYGGMGGDYHGNIAMSTCAYCWVRNIESDFAEGTAVGMYGTYRSEIRDSFIHGTSNPNPGGGGYLTGMHFGASDNLIENNILWQANKMIVMRASGGGNVVSYNYMEDGYGDGYKDIPEVGLNATHYTTPHMELLEGNEAWNCDGDSYWGNSVAITLFRNHLTGERRDVGGIGLQDLNLRRVASLNAFQYDYNFLGNVLGSEDMRLLPGQTRFVYEATSPDAVRSADGTVTKVSEDDNVVPMWVLGYNSDDHGQPFDPKVAETTIRHGNFDYVSKQVVWDPSLPKSLPPSLYLTSKPGFFGDHAWPWVTPEDATARTHVLPARERFDAMHLG